MSKITEPHSPATARNTDGYSAAELRRLNAVYVEAWNCVYGGVEMTDDEIFQHGKSLWDAINDADGDLTRVLGRIGWEG